ncbi:hypothetical protein, partial [Escherichia coli]|uniref:hypothetical protein n=1 Tax=Escherichia coli TaxID=562 RepID=UPI002550B392
IIKTITYLCYIGCLEIMGAIIISVRLEHLFKKKNASDYSGVAESIIQLSNTKITKSLKRITLHHVFF